MSVVENLVWPLVVTALAALGALLWQNWPTVRGWLKRHDIVAGDPRRFNVLVARLNGDDAKNSNRRHIVRSLRQQPGIEVVTDVKCFSEVEAGSDTDRVAEVRAAAQTRLQQTGCDIVVFGDVVAANQALYLHVLPAGGEGPGAHTYALEGQKLELPQDFSPAFGEALTAAALTAAAPAVDNEKRATYLVETLRPVREKLKAVLDVPPAGMTDSMRATFQVSYGNCCLTLGEQTGDADDLSEAVAAYRAVVEVRTPERLPLGWAMTQNNLGNALAILGEREEGTARFEHAVDAFDNALEVFGPDTAPAYRNMAMHNRERVVKLIGERRGVA